MSMTTSAHDHDHASAGSHDAVRALLEQHRAARNDQVQGYLHADPTLRDLDPGVQLRSLEAARRSLAEIEQALARLDAGTYGLCTGCSRPIAPERLDALPYVTSCVHCASAG